MTRRRNTDTEVRPTKVSRGWKWTTTAIRITSSECITPKEKLAAISMFVGRLGAAISDAIAGEISLCEENCKQYQVQVPPSHGRAIRIYRHAKAL